MFKSKRNIKGKETAVKRARDCLQFAKMVFAFGLVSFFAQTTKRRWLDSSRCNKITTSPELYIRLCVAKLVLLRQTVLILAH